MMIKFTKNITCLNAADCTKNFIEKLEKLYPDLIKAEIGKVRNYHYSIAHINNNHIFVRCLF